MPRVSEDDLIWLRAIKYHVVSWAVSNYPEGGEPPEVVDDTVAQVYIFANPYLRAALAGGKE